MFGVVVNVSFVQCPGDAPHLVIVNDNSEDLIMNAKFECVNYGSQQLWTVQHPTKNIPIKITEEGPVVYCTKTRKEMKQHWTTV